MQKNDPLGNKLIFITQRNNNQIKYNNIIRDKQLAIGQQNSLFKNQETDELVVVGERKRKGDFG